MQPTSIYLKKCSYMYCESSSPHLSTRAVKYHLNFTSLPCILCVHIKQGECCSTISEIDFELQLMNVNLTLFAIIWGHAKPHFVGISVDMNRENTFIMIMAKERMVIFQHNQLLSSIFVGLLQLWYVK